MILFTNMDAAGLLPMFFDEQDPRPAAEQADANYQHGGGWRPQPDWTLQFNRQDPMQTTAQYPHDPTTAAIAVAVLHDEVLVLFDYGYLAIVQPDGSFEMARMD